MNHDDALYRRMLNNQIGETAKPEDASYAGPGHTRNVYFLPIAGDGVFLNYAYLVSCIHNVEFTLLTLAFTTHTVMLKGVLLKTLFLDLMAHIPKMIIATDERYNATADEKKSVVNEIICTSGI